MAKNIKQPADRLVKKPRQVRVGIIGDEAVADQAEQTEQALADAIAEQIRSRIRRIGEHAQAGTEDPIAAVNDDDKTTLAPLLGKREQAVEALDRVTLWFTFQSIGRTAWARLVAEHPPNEDDHEEARQAAGDQARSAAWHRATLIPAAILASCVSPVLTEDDLDDMFAGGNWNDAELGALAAAALSVNTQARRA